MFFSTIGKALRRGFVAGLIVLAFTVSAWGGTWERVCDLMNVPRDAIQRPKIMVISRYCPEMQGLAGLYLFGRDYIIVVSGEGEDTYAHEMVHYILCSHYYQEREAYRIERFFK